MHQQFAIELPVWEDFIKLEEAPILQCDTYPDWNLVRQQSEPDCKALDWNTVKLWDNSDLEANGREPVYKQNEVISEIADNGYTDKIPDEGDSQPLSFDGDDNYRRDSGDSGSKSSDWTDIFDSDVNVDVTVFCDVLGKSSPAGLSDILKDTEFVEIEDLLDDETVVKIEKLSETDIDIFGTSSHDSATGKVEEINNVSDEFEDNNSECVLEVDVFYADDILDNTNTAQRRDTSAVDSEIVENTFCKAPTCETVTLVSETVRHLCETDLVIPAFPESSNVSLIDKHDADELFMPPSTAAVKHISECLVDNVSVTEIADADRHKVCQSPTSGGYDIDNASEPQPVYVEVFVTESLDRNKHCQLDFSTVDDTVDKTAEQFQDLLPIDEMDASKCSDLPKYAPDGVDSISEPSSEHRGVSLNNTNDVNKLYWLPVSTTDAVDNICEPLAENRDIPVTHTSDVDELCHLPVSTTDVVDIIPEQLPANRDVSATGAGDVNELCQPPVYSTDIIDSISGPIPENSEVSVIETTYADELCQLPVSTTDVSDSISGPIPENSEVPVINTTYVDKLCQLPVFITDIIDSIPGPIPDNSEVPLLETTDVDKLCHLPVSTPDAVAIISEPLTEHRDIIVTEVADVDEQCQLPVSTSGTTGSTSQPLPVNRDVSVTETTTVDRVCQLPVSATNPVASISEHFTENSDSSATETLVDTLHQLPVSTSYAVDNISRPLQDNMDVSVTDTAVVNKLCQLPVYTPDAVDSSCGPMPAIGEIYITETSDENQIANLPVSTSDTEPIPETREVSETEPIGVNRLCQLPVYATGDVDHISPQFTESVEISGFDKIDVNKTGEQYISGSDDGNSIFEDFTEQVIEQPDEDKYSQSPACDADNISVQFQDSTAESDKVTTSGNVIEQLPAFSTYKVFPEGADIEPITEHIDDSVTSNVDNTGSELLSESVHVTVAETTDVNTLYQKPVFATEKVDPNLEQLLISADLSVADTLDDNNIYQSSVPTSHDGVTIVKSASECIDVSVTDNINTTELLLESDTISMTDNVECTSQQLAECEDLPVADGNNFASVAITDDKLDESAISFVDSVSELQLEIVDISVKKTTSVNELSQPYIHSSDDIDNSLELSESIKVSAIGTTDEGNRLPPQVSIVDCQSFIPESHSADNIAEPTSECVAEYITANVDTTEPLSESDTTFVTESSAANNAKYISEQLVDSEDDPVTETTDRNKSAFVSACDDADAILQNIDESTTTNDDIASVRLYGSASTAVKENTEVNKHIEPFIHGSDGIDNSLGLIDSIKVSTIESPNEDAHVPPQVSTADYTDTIVEQISETFQLDKCDENTVCQLPVSITIINDTASEQLSDLSVSEKTDANIICQPPVSTTQLESVNEPLFETHNDKRSQSSVSTTYYIEHIPENVDVSVLVAPDNKAIFCEPAITDSTDIIAEQFSDFGDVFEINSAICHTPPVCGILDTDYTSEPVIDPASNLNDSYNAEADAISFTESVEAPVIDTAVSFYETDAAVPKVYKEIGFLDDNSISELSADSSPAINSESIIGSDFEYISNVFPIYTVNSSSVPDETPDESDISDKAEYSDNVFENADFVLELSTETSSVIGSDLCPDSSEILDTDIVFDTGSFIRAESVSAYEQLLKDCASPDLDDISKSSRTECDISIVSGSKQLPDFSTALKQLETAEFHVISNVDTADTSDGIDSKCLPEVDVVAVDNITAASSDISGTFCCLNVPTDDEVLSEYDNVGDIVYLSELDHELNDVKYTDSEQRYPSTIGGEGGHGDICDNSVDLIETGYTLTQDITIDPSIIQDIDEICELADDFVITEKVDIPVNEIEIDTQTVKDTVSSYINDFLTTNKYLEPNLTAESISDAGSAETLDISSSTGVNESQDTSHTGTVNESSDVYGHDSFNVIGTSIPISTTILQDIHHCEDSIKIDTETERKSYQNSDAFDGEVDVDNKSVNSNTNDAFDVIPKQLEVHEVEDINYICNYVADVDSDTEFADSSLDKTDKEIISFKLFDNDDFDTFERNKVETTHTDSTLIARISNIVSNYVADAHTFGTCEYKTESGDIMSDVTGDLSPVYIPLENDMSCVDDSLGNVSMSPDQDSDLEKSIKEVIKKFTIESPQSCYDETSSCTTPDAISTAEPDEVNEEEIDINTDILGEESVQDFSNILVKRREAPLTLEERKRLSLIFELDESDDSTDNLDTELTAVDNITSVVTYPVQDEYPSRDTHADTISKLAYMCNAELKEIVSDNNSFKHDNTTIIEGIVTINESIEPIRLDPGVLSESGLEANAAIEYLVKRNGVGNSERETGGCKTKGETLKDNVESGNYIENKIFQGHGKINADPIEDKHKIIVNALDTQYSDASDVNNWFILLDESAEDFDDVFSVDTETTKNIVLSKVEGVPPPHLDVNISDYHYPDTVKSLHESTKGDSGTDKVVGVKLAAIDNGGGKLNKENINCQSHISVDHSDSIDTSHSTVDSHVNNWISLESLSDESVYSYDHSFENAAFMQMKHELSKRLEQISCEEDDTNDIDNSGAKSNEADMKSNIAEQLSDTIDGKITTSETKPNYSSHTILEATDESLQNISHPEFHANYMDNVVDAEKHTTVSTDTIVEQGLHDNVSPKHVKGIDKVRERAKTSNTDTETRNLDRVQQLKHEAYASGRTRCSLRKQKSVDSESDNDRECTDTGDWQSRSNDENVPLQRKQRQKSKYHTYENVPKKMQDKEEIYHRYENVKHYAKYKSTEENIATQLKGDVIEKLKGVDEAKWQKADSHDIPEGKVDYVTKQKEGKEIYRDYIVKQDKREKYFQQRNSDKALYKRSTGVQSNTAYIVYPATDNISNKKAAEAIADTYAKDAGSGKMMDNCNTRTESQEKRYGDTSKSSRESYHMDTSTENREKDNKPRSDNNKENRAHDQGNRSNEMKEFGIADGSRFCRENYATDNRYESMEKNTCGSKYCRENYQRDQSMENRANDSADVCQYRRESHQRDRSMENRANDTRYESMEKNTRDGQYRRENYQRDSSRESREHDSRDVVQYGRENYQRDRSMENRADSADVGQYHRENYQRDRNKESKEVNIRDTKYRREDYQRNSSNEHRENDNGPRSSNKHEGINHTETTNRDRGQDYRVASVERSRDGTLTDRRRSSSAESRGDVTGVGRRSGRSQKDGPLSLTDTYGAGMDGDAHNSQSGSRVLSASSNNLSESTTSLSNRGYPGTTGTGTGVVTPQKHGTPHKHNTLQRDLSIQSETNGTANSEPGIKFERLKNLEEDELLVKIRDIMGHLERLEDYHRGDGMRIQKMLGDMYWDYTPLRETIGDTMATGGYAPVSMKMLKALNSIGIFKNDDVWFPTYYTYNTMWNFTDSSSKLAQALAENDAVRLLTLNCGHKPYINAIYSKNVYYVMKASLSILHNIARNHGMKHLFDENKTSETIMPFLKSEDEMLTILATLTIANIVDEEENKTLITETGTIHNIVTWIEKALNLPRRRYKGFTPQELTEGLNKLAVNDSNKMKILEEGALPLFLKMLLHDDVREQTSAARVTWTLAFDKEVRQKIIDYPDIVATLKKCTDSTNKSLQTNASGALWVIHGDNDVTRESRPKSAKMKSHVFLSYSWADKETVLAIRDRLRAEGYAIWIDVEKICGSTLDAMAAAVESSAVVLMFMSEKYKSSPNCRTEAEYTFQLRKDYIPIMMQRKYRPDGWLGMVMGAKLYFDFSGKYPFEKSFQGLLKELRGRGKVTPSHTPADDQPDGAIIDKSSSLSSSLGTPVHQVPSNSAILRMGQEELVKWLRNIKLTECIPTFLEFDGKLLMQLKVMRVEAPEFFYQCLEKKLNMSLIEILKFTRALEELQ